MTAQFYGPGAPLFTPGGVPAMDSNCCCGFVDCECTTLRSFSFCSCTDVAYDAPLNQGAITVTITGTQTSIPIDVYNFGLGRIVTICNGNVPDVNGSYVLSCSDFLLPLTCFSDFICSYRPGPSSPVTDYYIVALVTMNYQSAGAAGAIPRVIVNVGLGYAIIGVPSGTNAPNCNSVRNFTTLSYNSTSSYRNWIYEPGGLCPSIEPCNIAFDHVACQSGSKSLVGTLAYPFAGHSVALSFAAPS